MAVGRITPKWWFTAAALSAPLAAAAQVSNLCDVVGLVNTLALWFGIVVFIVAVIALLYTGFLFLISRGDEETVKKAKATLIYALLGIGLMLLATNADDIVRATTGGTSFDISQCLPGPTSTPF